MVVEFESNKVVRTLISEETQPCNQLKKEVFPVRYIMHSSLGLLVFVMWIAMIKRLEEDSSDLFELEGSDTLGSQFCIIPRVDGAPNITNCPIQWYRVISGGTRELISGMLSIKCTQINMTFPKSFIETVSFDYNIYNYYHSVGIFFGISCSHS